MRTLTEVTEAVRTNQRATEGELRLAICALDIILATQDENPEAFAELSDLPLTESVTWENSPANPEFVAWYAEQGEPEPAELASPGDFVTLTGEDLYRVAAASYNPAGGFAYGVPIIREVKASETPQSLYGLDLHAAEVVTADSQPGLFDIATAGDEGHC